MADTDQLEETAPATAPSPFDAANPPTVLVGHTNRDHGPDGPVRHAWAGDLEESADGEELAVAACGATITHRVAQPFEADDPRSCPACKAAG